MPKVLSVRQFIAHGNTQIIIDEVRMVALLRQLGFSVTGDIIDVTDDHYACNKAGRKMRLIVPSEMATICVKVDDGQWTIYGVSLMADGKFSVKLEYTGAI
jgi:hypothetical protein